jgi:hypothetical protein
MTSEQFVYWLSGFLSSKINEPHGLTRADTLDVMNLLKTVKNNTGTPIEFYRYDTAE